MADPFIGQIILFAGTFVPAGWSLCDGKSLPIASNTTLYSLIGTTYGGNATTFNLPDLRGRAPIGTGCITDNPKVAFPNIIPNVSSNIPSGMTGGQSQVVLTQLQLPEHSHPLAVSSANAVSSNPANGYLANATSQTDDTGVSISTPTSIYATTHEATAGPLAIGMTGANAPVPLAPPYIAMNYIIALTGTYPSHS